MKLVLRILLLWMLLCLLMVILPSSVPLSRAFTNETPTLLPLDDTPAPAPDAATYVADGTGYQDESLSIIIETLRADDFLRFGFVRVNQIWGVLLAGVALGVWLKRRRPSRARAMISYGVILVCIGVMMIVEFGLDKSTISNALLYAAMVLALIVIGVMSVAMRNACVRRATA